MIPGGGWFFLGFLAASFLFGAIRAERSSRASQRERFMGDLRNVDERLRVLQGDGWAIEEASFGPGFLTGHGYARWVGPDGSIATAEFEIPARIPGLQRKSTIREILD